MEGMGGEWKGWEVKEGEWEGNGRRTEGMGCKWKGWGWMGGGQLEVSLTDVSAAYSKKYIWIKT